MLCPQWVGLVGNAHGLCRHQLDLILTAQLQACLTREWAPWTTAPPRAGGRKAWINGTAGRQDAAELSASCTADPSLCCHGSRPRQGRAGSPALHKQGQHRALCPAPPATTTPLPGCCSHSAHPDSPGWITAESIPHPVSSVFHTTPTWGSRPQQHHSRAWSSSWLYPPVPRPGHAAVFQNWLEPGCPAGTQSCHLHPPQTHQSRLEQPDRLTCSLPFKFSCALGNRSRLDPVCSRRNHPGMEKCSQEMGRAIKGKDSSC